MGWGTRIRATKVETGARIRDGRGRIIKEKGKAISSIESRSKGSIGTQILSRHHHG